MDRVDHNPVHGGSIQVDHGKDVVSLMVTNLYKHVRSSTAIILTQKEAIELAVDLLIQSTQIENK